MRAGQVACRGAERSDEFARQVNASLSVRLQVAKDALLPGICG